MTTSLTWAGYLYLALIILGVASFIVQAGKEREPWPSGWGLLVTLTVYIGIAFAVLTVGTTR